MKFETKAIHTGQEPDKATGAVIVPIYQTSTYAQGAPGEHKGYEYSRTANPTRTALERCLASLEGAKFGLAFSSGMAATSTVMNLMKTNNHIISCDDLYGGTYRIFEKVYKDYGLEFSYVDLTTPENLLKVLKENTRMIWIETPTNPLLKIIDLSKVSRLARKHRLILAVDNTFATPYFQKPLLLGADIVVHSSTKYLGGHSDLVGGAILTSSQKYYDRMKFCQNAVGGVPGPFDCFLALRGLKTLSLRMREHQANAFEVSRFLSRHKKVKRVIYPGLKSHPAHNLAKMQMSGFGGIVSFELKSGLAGSRRFLKSLKLFFLAESLGGVESLADHPAIMTHSSVPLKLRKRLGISDSLIRLSVGIENKEDLLEDLRRSLTFV
ncbi:MAG: PLP-dependent aspartate aminotransferase family protein [candidate division Zixibacteria bacterium]|nr:PLP-dependent aspartate aminotransferase family protein [candidate division Zixibacteria bacterium]